VLPPQPNISIKLMIDKHLLRVDKRRCRDNVGYRVVNQVTTINLKETKCALLRIKYQDKIDIEYNTEYNTEI